MNQQQYIRLSIVLAVPTLILSLYMGQQDVFYERGQFVQCSVSEAYCDAMINSSKNISDRHLTYNIPSPKKFLGLYDINAPMKIYFESLDDGKMLDVSSLVNSRMLETHNCMLLQRELMCGTRLLSSFSTIGRIEFINPEDEAAFNAIVEEGESYFEDYTLNRIVEGFGLFLIFATPYLIFSWLVHYVIYGAKIGPKKKTPYQ